MGVDETSCPHADINSSVELKYEVPLQKIKDNPKISTGTNPATTKYSVGLINFRPPDNQIQYNRNPVILLSRRNKS